MPNYAQKQHITGAEMKEDSYKEMTFFFTLKNKQNETKRTNHNCHLN